MEPFELPGPAREHAPSNNRRKIDLAAFGVRGPAADTPPGDRFNPSRIGLDHVALGCADESELNRVAEAPQAAGVENTGVKLDETLGKRYVAFKDADRIAWEFYTA